MMKGRQRGAAIVLLLAALLACWGLRAAEAMPDAEAGRAAKAAASKKDPPPRPVDINVANIKELEELPGVGPTTAQSIINFRQKSGRFHRIEDLLVIRGISRRKFETMRPYITVGSPPPAPKPATPPATKPATATAKPPATPAAKPSTAPSGAKPPPAAKPAPPSTPPAKAGASSTTPAKPSAPAQNPAPPQ